LTPNVVLGCESHPSTALCRRVGPRWLTITLSQSNLFQNEVLFTYSLFIDCSPVQKNDHRQCLEMAHAHPCVPTMARSYIHILSATWRRASSFPGSRSRRDRIPGLPHLFPSGTTRTATACRKNRRPMFVAAFEHSDRIREIHLPVTIGYSFWISICNTSFLELEHPRSFRFRYPFALPHEFMGGVH